MSACVFCSVLAGTVPGSFAYRDDRVAAFMDIQPVNPGHLLVVPVVHATHLAEIDGVMAARIMTVAHHLAAALRASDVRCEGVNLFLADGAAAMQEVPHVHLHVIPRYKGDGFGLTFGPDYGKHPPRAQLERLATQLRTTLGGPAP